MDAGNRLGHFQIVEPLEAGGMGVVYRAHDTKLGRDAAVKLVPDNVLNGPCAPDRLRREATLLAALGRWTGSGADTSH